MSRRAIECGKTLDETLDETLEETLADTLPSTPARLGSPYASSQPRFVSSPPGDEPLPPVVRLRRFQVLECRHSSGDTTVIDRDKVRGKGTHTHTSGVRPISGIPL